jgi:hypothetical protein
MHRVFVLLGSLVAVSACTVAPNATSYIEFGTDGCGRPRSVCGAAECVEASSIEPPPPGGFSCTLMYVPGERCVALQRCERQPSGRCGHTPTAAYHQCMEEERQFF